MEKGLSKIELEWKSILDKINLAKSLKDLSETDMLLLRIFVLFQNGRTLRGKESAEKASESFIKQSIAAHIKYDPSVSKDIQLEDLTGIECIVGGDLGVWGTKNNNIHNVHKDKINELVVATNTINGAEAGLSLKEDKINKGQANGYVPLNSSTLIDSQYLPSYVDDVVNGYYLSGVFYMSVQLNIVSGTFYY